MTAWWNNKYGKNAICGITHSRLRKGKYCIFLPCSHGFYKKALKGWVDTGKDTCPMCRKKFNISLLREPEKDPVYRWIERPMDNEDEIFAELYRALSRHQSVVIHARVV